MATHYTFFGQIGGITRQCALCQELLVVNASTVDLASTDVHRLWSSTFEKHIRERHAPSSCGDDVDTCVTARFVM